MKRSIFALLAGFALWAVVATLLNFGLRAGIPGYHQAEPSMNFTFGMRIARLIVGALSSLSAGAIAALIAPSRRGVPWLLGTIVLALFIPGHIRIWASFPVWYHLVFLLTLAPLVALGAAMVRGRSANSAPKSAANFSANAVSNHQN